MPSIVKRTSKDGKSTTYQVKCRFKEEKPFSKTSSKLRDAKHWAADMQSGRDDYTIDTSRRTGRRYTRL